MSTPIFADYGLSYTYACNAATGGILKLNLWVSEWVGPPVLQVIRTGWVQAFVPEELLTTARTYPSSLLGSYEASGPVDSCRTLPPRPMKAVV